MRDVPTVLLVCFGNLCRSPMAEALLRARLDGTWQVRSAGTGAIGGDPPTAAAREVLAREAGIDIGEYRSTPLTVGVVRAADQVLTMSVQQAYLVAALEPAAAGRVRLLGAFAPATHSTPASADPGGPPATLVEIADPMGGDDDAYLACYRRLVRALDRVAPWLRAGAPPAEAPLALAHAHWPVPVRT